MGSRKSDDHIDEGHINVDITTCNIEEPQLKFRKRIHASDRNSSLWLYVACHRETPQELILQDTNLF